MECTIIKGMVYFITFILNDSNVCFLIISHLILYVLFYAVQCLLEYSFDWSI